MPRKKSVVDPERGARLRTLIEKSPYKLGEVCEHLDISRTALDQILKGNTFQLDTITALSELLNIDLDYIVKGHKSTLISMSGADENLAMEINSLNEYAKRIKKDAEILTQKLNALQTNR